MSTRSAVGYEIPEGNVIRAVYVHFDGYYSGVGKTLIENYDYSKLYDAVDLGNMSSLGDDVESCVFYGRDRGEDNTKYSEFLHRHDFVHDGTYSGCEYFYLLTKDGEWLCSEGGKFVPLENKLNHYKIAYTKYNDKDKPQLNAKDTVIDLVNKGIVEPEVMIKYLLDIVDSDAVAEMLSTYFTAHYVREVTGFTFTVGEDQ